MAVQDTHKQYDSFADKWQRMRDVLEGQDAVHAASTKYLPKLTEQTNSEYKDYISRALFYGATARTHSALSGLIFRKPPSLEAPQGILDIEDDITLTGKQLSTFVTDIVDEVLLLNRVGILVDHPVIDETITSRAEAERLNLRPFLKVYKAENIINWETSSCNNIQCLTQVRLKEIVVEKEGEFESIEIEQIRVLDINEFGFYRQRIFREDEKLKNEWVQFGDDVIPTMGGLPLNSIPFVFISVKDLEVDVNDPPLLDLANAKLSHYRTTADLEHGAHFTGLPTAVIAGLAINPEEKEGASYKIGSATAWVFPDPATKAFYLEFTGQGLDSLSNLRKDKEQYMAFLGSRVLLPEKKGVEAATTVQLNKVGEDSVLSSVSHSVSRGITRALNILAEWMGINGDISYKLNTDFMPNSMTPQEIMSLMQLWQSGGLSFNDLVENLKKGEIIRSSKSLDDIKQEIQEDSFLIGGENVEG